MTRCLRDYVMSLFVLGAIALRNNSILRVLYCVLDL